MAPSMADVHKLADRLWRGEIATTQPEHHPFAPLNELVDVSDSLVFWKGFVNLSALRTDEGLVLIDTGSFHAPLQKRIFEAVRSWSREPLRTAIYTHGHVDHAWGLPPFLEEAEQHGWSRPEIVAHSAVLPRMEPKAVFSGFPCWWRGHWRFVSP